MSLFWTVVWPHSVMCVCVCVCVCLCAQLSMPPWWTCTAISADMQLVYHSSPYLASRSAHREVRTGTYLYVCMSFSLCLNSSYPESTIQLTHSCCWNNARHTRREHSGCQAAVRVNAEAISQSDTTSLWENAASFLSCFWNTALPKSFNWRGCCCHSNIARSKFVHGW